MSCRSRKWPILFLTSVLLFGGLGAAPGNAAPGDAAPARYIELSAECPPSFEKTPAGTCHLVTLYDLYDAPNGYAGMHMPLPKARDGFRPQVIDLGRYLFFDPILSRFHDSSCASCHDPSRSFTDGQGRATGHGGTALQRGTPTLWNIAFLSSFGWNGGTATLEDQNLKPMLAANELGNTKEQIEADLNGSTAYRSLFAQAFRKSPDARITLEQVEQALVAFEGSLISLNSRYDRYAHGDESALSAQEIEGFVLFNSFVTRCSQCHTPPLFTNGELAAIGAPEPRGAPFDHGAGEGTTSPELNGAFRVPTLRNIALTAPYMHSGVFQSLEDVVDFYNARTGPRLPPGEHVILHWNIHGGGLGLSPHETAAISAFMKTLTDESLRPAVPTSVPSGLIGTGTH